MWFSSYVFLLRASSTWHTRSVGGSEWCWCSDPAGLWVWAQSPSALSSSTTASCNTEPQEKQRCLQLLLLFSSLNPQVHLPLTLKTLHLCSLSSYNSFQLMPAVESILSAVSCLILPAEAAPIDCWFSNSICKKGGKFCAGRAQEKQSKQTHKLLKGLPEFPLNFSHSPKPQAVNTCQSERLYQSPNPTC